jgi:guanylate kinase
MNRKAIIFSAPSGSGKTTIIHRLLAIENDLSFSVSACSRKMREGETDGKDYYFLTQEEFKKKIAQNEFIEWEEVYGGNYYGTLKSEVERLWISGKSIVFDVDVLGGINLKKYFADKALLIYLMPPSIQVLEQRLRLRHTESEESLQKRLLRADKELSYYPQFDFVVTNNNLEKAIDETRELVKNFLKKK